MAMSNSVGSATFRFRPIRDRDLGHEFTGETAPDWRQKDVRNRLLSELIIARRIIGVARLFYSRDRNFYASERRYLPRAVGRQSVVNAVDFLERTKLVGHTRTFPGVAKRFRSTIQPGKLLLEADIPSLPDFQYDVCEPIVLKNAERRQINYTENLLTRTLRADVDDQNKAMAALQLTIGSDQFEETQRGLLVRRGAIKSDDIFVFPMLRSLRRVFNVDWNRGGRFYGAFWQQLASAYRSCILVNGETVIEHDYPTLHPRLLAAMFGLNFGDEDPYCVPGVERVLGKPAFNILINAASENSAILALQREISVNFCDQLDESPGQKARNVINAFKEHHKGFTDAWHTGIGLSLQRIDSDIAMRVQRIMRETASPVLSVHDSFISKKSEENILLDAMNDTIEAAIRILRRKRPDVIGELRSTLLFEKNV